MKLIRCNGRKNDDTAEGGRRAFSPTGIFTPWMGAFCINTHLRGKIQHVSFVADRRAGLSAIREKGWIWWDVTGQEYRQMNKKVAPKSPTLLNCVKAFLIGGFICTIGETIAQLVMNTGMEEKDARFIGSLALIFLSVALTGFNVYDNIAKHAGAGTLVPITGFANAVASPAIEFKTEGLVTGLAAKMFLIAGPVLVYGITASAVYGIILYIVGLF